MTVPLGWLFPGWLPATLAAQGASPPRWLLELLSVDTRRLEGGTEHFRFARFPEGGLGLLALLAVAAGFAVIAWIYRLEGQLSRPRKILLASLRSAVLLVAALVLFYPVLEVDRAAEFRATTIVLVDGSLSHGIRDRYQGDTARRDALALALGLKPEEVAAASRAELVGKALSSESLGVLKRLAEKNQIQAHAFSALPLESILLEPRDAGARPAAPEGSPADAGAGERTGGNAAPSFRLAAVEPKGPVTDIAGALLEAVEVEGGGKIAGIVLLTDGRVTAGQDLKGAAAVLSEKGIPVHAVGVGDPTPTRNLRVTAVLASDRVFTGDPIVVDVRLDQHGFDGESARVELLDAYEPPGEAPRAPVKVDAADVAFAAGRADGAASFRFQPQGVGRHRLTVRVEPRPDETFAADNERTAAVEVVKEASKVLLFAGGPTYEYRFLKNLLRRDSRVSVAAWLQSADPDYPQEGDVSLKKIPADAKALFEYDVVGLMDVDPRGLPPGYPQLLEEFVGKHKGGLLFVAGSKHATAFFEDIAMAPLRNMLPVAADAGDLRDELERGGFYDREWHLEPTPAAMDHAATRLSAQVDRNRELWAEIAGVFWSFPARKAKPGATVLFVHPSPSLAREGQPRPLVATQYYEGGRIAYLGIDSTWRWRATAEEVYDRFWIQTVRFLTEGRLLGDRRRVIETDRESYDLGDAVRISVLLQDENYKPLEAEQTVLRVEGPDGASQDLTLEKDLAAPGWFRGAYSPRALGLHKLHLEGGAERAFSVETPALEFAVQRLDEEALRELAKLTGGSYRTLAEVASLPEAIPDRRQTVVTTDEPIPLWDNWMTLGLLAGFLTLEWVLRKVNRLL